MMRLRILAALLALASPALVAPHCLTYEEKTLGRLQTLCDDGTRAISTWNRTLERWETTMTPPRPVVKPPRHPLPQAPRR
jgi:hypothetical protein